MRDAMSDKHKAKARDGQEDAGAPSDRRSMIRHEPFVIAMKRNTDLVPRRSNLVKHLCVF